MSDFRVYTNPNYPVFDPNDRVLLKVLAFFRLAKRSRFAVMNPQETAVCCHPINTPVIENWLKARGQSYTVGPLLGLVGEDRK